MEQLPFDCLSHVLKLVNVESIWSIGCTSKMLKLFILSPKFRNYLKDIVSKLTNLNTSNFNIGTISRIIKNPSVYKPLTGQGDRTIHSISGSFVLFQDGSILGNESDPVFSDKIIQIFEFSLNDCMFLTEKLNVVTTHQPLNFPFKVASICGIYQSSIIYLGVNKNLYIDKTDFIAKFLDDHLSKVGDNLYKFRSVSNVIQCSTSYKHFLTLDINGYVRAFGDTQYCGLGNRKEVFCFNQIIPNLQGVVKILVSGDISLVLTKAGLVYFFSKLVTNPALVNFGYNTEIIDMSETEKEFYFLTRDKRLYTISKRNLDKFKGRIESKCVEYKGVERYVCCSCGRIIYFDDGTVDSNYDWICSHKI